MACVFCKIAAGEIPSKVVHSDDALLAFHDIAPRAPVHVLIVPRKHIGSIAEAEDGDRDVFGRMLLLARDVAQKLGIAERGYRLIVNVREHGGQEVPHLHLHVLGGRTLGPMLARPS
jgi:histidine triad (HIT) family protein